jgi:hypothetical protein
VSTVNALLQKMEDAMRPLGAPPLTEIGIHPDDLRELRQQAGPHVEKLDIGKARFDGVLLIEDPKAERLPRKAV